MLSDLLANELKLLFYFEASSINGDSASIELIVKNCRYPQNLELSSENFIKTGYNIF